jgi:hypothetical protein
MVTSTGISDHTSAVVTTNAVLGWITGARYRTEDESNITSDYRTVKATKNPSDCWPRTT